MQLSRVPGHPLRRRVHLSASCRRTAATAASRKTGLAADYLRERLDRSQRSYVIGDRDTDMELARNLGVAGLRVRRQGGGGRLGSVARRLAMPRRTARDRTPDPRDRNRGRARSRPQRAGQRSRPESASSITCWSRSPSTAASRSSSRATATCTSTSTTRSRTARSRWARRCARRSATSAASRRYGFLLPMDEAWPRSRSISPAGRTRSSKAVSAAKRSAVCRRSWCRTSSARWPTACGAALHITVQGENTHHMIEACFKGVGRALRQAVRDRGHGAAEQQGRRSRFCMEAVAIVDSGGANIASLRYAFERLGVARTPHRRPARGARRSAR